MSNYKLVPVEPTKKMRGAGEYALEVGCYASGIYADMLADAPVVNIVATKNEQGQIVSVTLQDEDHHILQVIAEADVQEESEPCQECGGDGAGGEHEEDCVMVQITPDVATLVEAMEPLMKGYASLLEGGIDRITHLDGDCDLILDMLQDAQTALAVYRKKG